MAMIGRKVDDGGLLVDEECVRPLKNESWRVVGQTRFFNRAGRRDDGRKQMQSRHVTDQPAKPLSSHYDAYSTTPPSTQDPAMPLSSLIRRPCSIPNSRQSHEEG
jgi:hypothetical protein